MSDGPFKMDHVPGGDLPNPFENYRPVMEEIPVKIYGGS